MKNQLRIIISLLSIAVLLATTACSTQKNTWASRNYHAMTTRYNIYYNGNNSYIDGLNVIDKAAEDDYSSILPLYSVSHHEAAQAATSEMDRTIEKCRKCIKLHSIKVKPKPDPKRRGDPKYKAFMAQEEYNRHMDDAWLLLGKAEFHKGDFLGAVGTFNYIIRHYSYDKDMVAQCQLWVVRAYGEMGWLYEAEELMAKINPDDISRKNRWLYSATFADLKLKNKQYTDAVPLLKKALPDERREQQLRYYFILGQIYAAENDKQAAVDMLKKVIRKSPPAEMDFNARLMRTKLSGDIKALDKMAKQPKNKNRLDYIYGAAGDILLEKQDTTGALMYYDLAIEKSVTGGAQKATILIQAADLYYTKKNYQKAAPYYSEAAGIISIEHDDYQRVRRLSETLDELVLQENIVTLQDSLQRLSKLSEEEQLKIVEKLIADLEQAEKEEAERQLLAEREAMNNEQTSVDTRNMLGGGGAKANWYFYNAQLLKSGKQDFNRRWGNRKLEDNWRRQIKTLSSNFTSEESNENYVENDSVEGETRETSSNNLVTDNKDPQYYLQQIPKTDEDIAVSNAQIADALYQMVGIYRDKLEDELNAQQTEEEFARRFPNDQRGAELLFVRYLQHMRKQDKLNAEAVRKQILQDFSDSEPARILSQPDYFERISRMQAEQDSLYEATYASYLQGDYAQVKSNKRYAEENLSSSKLMPRFLFLNAIAIARTEGQEPFIAALQEMVERYPESENGAMAKDMLAMMNQGMESQTGDIGASSLLDKRGEFTADTDTTTEEISFSIEKRIPSVVLLVTDNDEADLNQLLFEVALFNFSRFLVKDFELKPMPIFGNTGKALRIEGMESYDEAVWYKDIIREDVNVSSILQNLSARIICITEENLNLLLSRFTEQEYSDFCKENNL